MLTGNEQRIFVRSDQIAPVMKHAIIAIEDRRFYTNDGVDLRGIGRALVPGHPRAEAVQGGSTITQQFVKNALRRPERAHASSRSCARPRSPTTSRASGPRSEILRNYLNTIYFGNGAYGIESAARTYFGTNHPRLRRRRRAARARRCSTPARGRADRRHGRLAERLRPARSTREAAAQAPRPRAAADARAGLHHAARSTTRRASSRCPTRRDIQPPAEDTAYPYFTSWVKQQVVDQLGGGQEGARRAFEGGLTVQTTLDSPPGRRPGRGQRSGCRGPGGPRASLVAIDNDTGEVLAMVGGDDYNDAAVQPRHAGPAPAGLGVQAVRPRRGAAPRASRPTRPGRRARSTSASRVPRRAAARSTSTSTTTRTPTRGVTHAAHARRRSPTTRSTPRSACRSGTKKIAQARAPDGHPHAGLDEPRDDARRPARGRHRRSTWRTPTRRSRSGGRLTYGHAEPGRGRPPRAAQRVPGPAGIQRIGTADDGKLKPSSCRRRERGRRDDWPVLKSSVADQVSSMLDRSSTQRHRRRARRSPGDVRRRQDRHDRELRRRVVRRLDDGDHRRGLGRLPGRAQADGDRVPRRAGRRRHLPGARSGRRSSSSAITYEDVRRATRTRTTTATPSRRADHAPPPPTARRPRPAADDARARDERAERRGRRRRPRRPRPSRSRAAPAAPPAPQAPAAGRRRRRRRPRPDDAGPAQQPAPRHAAAPRRRAERLARGTAPPQRRRRSPGGHGRDTLREPRRRSATAARPPS